MVSWLLLREESEVLAFEENFFLSLSLSLSLSLGQAYRDGTRKWQWSSFRRMLLYLLVCYAV